MARINYAKAGSVLTVIVSMFVAAFVTYWVFDRPQIHPGAVMISNAALVGFYFLVRGRIPAGLGVRPVLLDAALAVFLGVAFLCTEEFYDSRISGSIVRLVWIFGAAMLLSAYFDRRFPKEDAKINKS